MFIFRCLADWKVDWMNELLPNWLDVESELLIHSSVQSPNQASRWSMPCWHIKYQILIENRWNEIGRSSEQNERTQSELNDQSRWIDIKQANAAVPHNRHFDWSQTRSHNRDSWLQVSNDDGWRANQEDCSVIAPKRSTGRIRHVNFSLRFVHLLPAYNASNRAARFTFNGSLNGCSSFASSSSFSLSSSSSSFRLLHRCSLVSLSLSLSLLCRTHRGRVHFPLLSFFFSFLAPSFSLFLLVVKCIRRKKTTRALFPFTRKFMQFYQLSPFKKIKREKIEWKKL